VEPRATPGGAMAALTRVCTLRGHEDRVWCIAWRPCSEPLQLASCGTDRIMRIWGHRANAALDAEDGWVLLSEIDATERHTRTLRSVTWDASGDVLTVTSFDASASLWQEVPRQEDSRGGRRFQCVGVVTGHENEVKSAAFSPSGDYLATCSRDKSVWVYETAKNFEYECVALLQSHTQDVKTVRWHPEQDVLFSCSYDDTIKVWGPDGDDWCCKETLSGHESTVWSLSFDAVGSRFVTSSDDRTLRVWTPAAEAPRSDAASETASSFAPQARSLAAAAYVSPLFRGSGPLNSATAAAPAASRTDSAPPAAARRPPADAACGWRCTAIIRDEHPRPVYSVDWLPFATSKSSTSIASACGDNHVRIFQPRNEATLEDWSCIADIEAHGGDANCVAWCPKPLADGGALLASAGDDAEVVLWRFGG